MKIIKLGAGLPWHGLPARERTEAVDRRIEPVLLIHGTNANRHVDGKLDWWHPGSPFCHEIDGRLERAGFPARCWANLTPSGQAAAFAPSSPFAWTGANSERGRRDAGRVFAAHIADLESDPRIRRFHVVAHSHGGNVTINALRALAQPPRKLGAVIYLGTPVLSFGGQATARLQTWLAAPMYLAVAVTSAWVGRLTSSQEASAAAVVVGVVALSCAVMEIHRSIAGNPGEAGSLYGSGTPSAFVFPGDEAVAALRLARDVVRSPRPFVRQLLARDAGVPPAFVRSTAVSQEFLNGLKASTPYRLFEALGLQSVLGLASAAPAPTHWTPMVPRRPSPLQVTSTISGALDGIPWLKAAVALILLALTVLPVGIVTLAILAARAILWLVGVSLGWTMLAVGRTLLWIVLPPLVKRSAFGADAASFFKDLENLPPGVAAFEVLDEDTRREIEAVADRVVNMSGQGLLRALTDADALSIKQKVRRALTDPTLVHSHYYHSAAVLDRIATLIVATPVVPQPAPSLMSSATILASHK